ncbi:MAG: LCP family protein [Firmicutes bacterium]|nr:LCP family protein [Bacillota bacterium]MDD7601451.1 LCP family protein [Bacillota bacterium]MDY5857021.1 LCP family protein [Anaerovoracaceae bacterium]
MSRTEKKHRRSLLDWFRGLATWKKITLLVAVIVILALLIVGVVVYGYMHSALDQMHEATPEDYDLSLTDVDGYINILLLGVDSRDMDNIQGTRSDAIMIVSINKDTNDVKVVSVYRDTFLKIGDTSTFDKITHACAYDGPEMSMKSLNQAMDLNISNYVVVNFKAVADLVDAVGGITVDVEDYEIQQLNKYTIQTAKNIGRENYKLVEAAGTQTLEGVQAVSYGRIRKGVGDDFKRTERMRTVLSLVFSKMKTMSFGEIKGLIDMMIPQVKTNLDMNNIFALAARLPKFNIVGSVGWPYDVTSGYINGVSYVLPQDLAANTTRLHQEVFLQEDYTPSATVTAISNELAVRIQGARDNNQIRGEKPVQTSEQKDPTQVAENTENSRPDTPNPGTTDPETPEPGTTDPETPDPGTTDPGTTDPETPDPGTTDPGTTDPGATDPGAADPGTTPTDPTSGGSETTDPGTAYDDPEAVSQPGT